MTLHFIFTRHAPTNCTTLKKILKSESPQFFSSNFSNNLQKKKKQYSFSSYGEHNCKQENWRPSATSVNRMTIITSACMFSIEKNLALTILSLNPLQRPYALRIKELTSKKKIRHKKKINLVTFTENKNRRL